MVTLDGAAVSVLGCAGMVGIDAEMQRQLGVAVVDGVAAVKLAGTVGGRGLSTSKIGMYRPVAPRRARDLAAAIAAVYGSAGRNGPGAGE